MTTTNSDIVTYPSISSKIFEVPEPEGITGKFNYNYFLPNEKESTDTFFNSASFNSRGQRYARTVSLEFKPVSALIPESNVFVEIQLSDIEKRRILVNNQDKIKSEVDFMNSSFMSFRIEDKDLTGKILSDVIATAVNDKREKFVNETNPITRIKEFLSITSDSFTAQSLLENITSEKLESYKVFDPDTGSEIKVSQDKDINDITFNIQASKRFAGDILAAASKSPLSTAGRSLSDTFEDISEIQADARNAYNSRVIKASDFIESYVPIKTHKINLDDVFYGGNTVMGYRIEKTDTLTGETENIFITNAQANSYTDVKVTYDRTYNYAIRVVYLVRFYSLLGNTAVAADLLVESRRSPSIDVVCKEFKPPQPPCEVNFYMQPDETLVIEWDFPFNKTEDIKRFQVFRRASIYEPFVLIGELDFDDSTILTPRSEDVLPFLVKKVKNPTLSFADPGFDLDSDFIYAVCSVDAHDLSSGYSIQQRVRFNKIPAKLEVELISREGAPKPYPNFNLSNELTVDAMRDSNHSAVMCYFDPEHLKLVNSAGENIEYLSVSADKPTYKLQLIHLNFQQSAVVDINIK